MNNPQHLTLPLAEAAGPTRHVFVRDLVLAADIGVWGFEHGRRQRVRINLDLMVTESGAPFADDLSAVVCYQEIIDRVKAIIDQGHVKLVETLAEKIAQCCLQDERIQRARVRVEKLDAVAEAASVGVEIERLRQSYFS